MAFNTVLGTQTNFGNEIIPSLLFRWSTSPNPYLSKKKKKPPQIKQVKQITCLTCLFKQVKFGLDVSTQLINRSGSD